MASTEDKLSLPFPDERKSPRRLASVAATVREPGAAPMQAQLLDVSSNGCRLGDCRLERGAEIWLQLPGREPCRATVVWSRGRRAGCRFNAPAKSQAADHRARATGPARRVLFGPGAAPRPKN